MLGIVMGVFSVITIVAIGNAAEAYMNAEFDKLGANFIQIQHKGKDLSKSDYLSVEDFNVIKKAAPEIRNIATYTQTFGELTIGNKKRDTVVLGSSSQFFKFEVRELAAGRFINDIDISTNSNSVMVDEYFAKRYFKKIDIIGEIITLKSPDSNTMKLKVVGVVKAQGAFDSMMDNEDFTTVIYMPLTTAQRFFNEDKLQSIYVSMTDRDTLKEVGERIVKALEFKHNNKNKYAATSSADLQKSISGVLGVVSSVLLVIAVITLIVGGIGIINILLVSVTERIREIGIRKALGAQKRDIIMQFLTESIVMTGISGLIGILLGVIAGNVIASLIKIPPTVDWAVVILSFLGSVTLGLIFGVYPAKRAADLDPIESLRYE
jgi:putative ABC transport system permease protein